MSESEALTFKLKTVVEKALGEHHRLLSLFVEQNRDRIVEGAKRVAACISSGNKLLIFGNGGSAADAQHIAAEFVNRFQMERPPLAALALTTDTSVITSIGNDFSFDEIFSKQVSALGQVGDIALGISTSGNSENVVKALTVAQQNGLITFGFSGLKGRIERVSHWHYCVASDQTARVQEIHLFLAHLMCDLVERELFGTRSICR